MASRSILTLCAHAHLAYRLGAEFDLQQAAAHATWEAAPVLTLARWLEQGWAAQGDRLLLTAGQEALLWQSIIASSHAGGDLLDLPATAARVAASWRLAHAWHLDWPAADWQSSEEAAAFHSWARAMRAACKSNAWLTAAELPDALAPLLAGLPLPAQLHLAGFDADALTPQRRTLLHSLSTAGVAINFDELPPDAASPQLDSATDAAAELERAALWARRRLEQGVPGLVGVIVPDVAQRRAEVERVFAQVFHPELAPWDPSPRAFHIATAPPLATAPAVAAALAMLATLLEPEPLELASVLALLRSPFLAGAETEAAGRAALEQQLRRRNAPRWRCSDVAARAAKPCPRFAGLIHQAQRLCRTWPRTQSHSAWLEAFASLWQALGWPGDRPLDSAAWQTQHAWERLLDEFGRLDQVSPDPISGREACARLRRLAAQQRFQPQTAPAPVEILSLREAEGLACAQLRVCGLHDEAVPAASQPDPFLPLAWQHEVHLPQVSAEAQAAAARRGWQRLCRQSPVLIASYPRQRADEQPLRPSPLLAGIAAAVTESYAPSRGAIAEVEPLADPYAGPLAPGHSSGGSSLLKDQSACPFRAFAHKRLNARESSQIAAGLPATDRGTLLHALLARVRDKLDPQAPLPAKEALAAQIAQLAAAVVEGAAALRDQPAIAEVERERLTALACAWFDEVERQRLPFLRSTLESQAEAKLGDLRLILKRDRVDELADGSLALFDYKSGKVSLAAWQGDFPEEPQLPLYVITEPDPGRVAAIAFSQVRAGEMKLVGLERAPGTLSAAPLQRTRTKLLSTGQIAAWRARLTLLADEFQQGYAAVQPRQRKSCQYCDLALLCRIDESGCGARGEEEESDGDLS